MGKFTHKKINIAILIFITLLIIFTCISGLYIYVSSKSINELGRYACNLDEDNNKILISGLMSNLIKGHSERMSQHLRIAINNVRGMEKLVQHCLTSSGTVNQRFKNQIKLLKLNKTNVLFDVSTNQNILRYYWGKDYHPPPHVIEKMALLSQNSIFFSSIYNISPRFYFVLYVVAKDGFTFDYPARTRYLNVGKSKEFYQKIYPFNRFPSRLENKNEDTSYPIIAGPYEDFSGKIVVDIKSPVYFNGELIAYTGIDIDYLQIRNSMLDWQLHLNKKNNIESFSFILGKNNNIIAFPEKFIDLFSLPKTYMNFSNKYISHDIKFSSSRNQEIRSFNRKILDKQFGVHEIVLNGNIYIIAIQNDKETGWTLGCVVKKEDIMSSISPTVDLINIKVKQVFLNYLWMILAFLIICFLFLLFVFKSYIVKPIQAIIREVKKVSEGNFNINLEEKGINEIAELSSTFNYMGKQLNEYMENLKNETRARLAFETEIQIAEKIQKSILPADYKLPTYGKFEIVARLNAAKNVSGDFYDFFYVKENTLAVVLADVSGKGLPAAFFMSMSKILIKNQCLLNPINPAEVLSKVNNALSLDNHSQMFTTAILGFYNIDDGTFIYASAGHHQAIFLKNGKIKRAEHVSNIALGICENYKYKLGSGKLEVGEIVLNYTDGVTEAISPDGKEYGEERLENLLINNNSLHLDEICSLMIDDVIKFEMNARFDDITILAIKRLK
ncbi:MAG: SpoIIE family protein phosphatase [bacterium]|nr:SpoIIE family protein phosphatase [bacterium]